MASGEDSESLDWNTEDELEITNFISTRDHASYNPEEASSSRCHMFHHFSNMGFSKESIAEAINKNGDGKEDEILDFLLANTYSEIIPQQPLHPNSDQSSSEYDDGYLDDFSDSGSFSEEENKAVTPEETLSFLKNMGYTEEEASTAMDRCGQKAPVDELTDFIFAAQMARTHDASLQEVSELKRKLNQSYHAGDRNKKRRLHDTKLYGRKKNLYHGIKSLRLPNPMVGFGVPVESMPEDAPSPKLHRSLREQATGTPFFYYENVALAPAGVWERISHSLYGIEPEIVDSRYFCAAQRKRAYVHNLPLQGRFTLKPLQHRTIHEAFPHTKRWWPKWDKRTSLNCIQTALGSAVLTRKITNLVKGHEGDPPPDVQKKVLEECRRWNLVWVGNNKVAPLEAHEVEYLMGFPENHTRGGGVNKTERYKSLGNAFQVDTVAYHLSVLEPMFPNGINVLSLFSGIGGAEVALHRLGIRLKNVISVEKSEVNRNVVRDWWEQTCQEGNLDHYDDVRQIDEATLKKIVKSIGKIDLVIGGSPCNNLSGSNRRSRDGLEGKDSSLFFEFARILDLVKSMTVNQ